MIPETHPAGRDNPFVGLRPFDYVDREYFFGRKVHVLALSQLVVDSKFSAVVGNSGSGKSSLVRAGLLPCIADIPAPERWCWAQLRPGASPLHNLAVALAGSGEVGPEAVPVGDFSEARRERVELLLRRSNMGISDSWHHMQWCNGRRLLIVVDQFEEIFRFAELRNSSARDNTYVLQKRNEASAFVQLLLNGTRDVNVPIHVILTMRSDFIGDCAHFQGLPEAVVGCQFLVPGLSRDQREAVIREPVAKAGGEIEPELVQQLLNDIGDETDQLPVLQHLLMRCWRKAVERRDGNGAPGQPSLMLGDYARAGGAADALSIHAQEILDELGTEFYPAAKILPGTNGRRSRRTSYSSTSTSLSTCAARDWCWKWQKRKKGRPEEIEKSCGSVLGSRVLVFCVSYGRTRVRLTR